MYGHLPTGTVIYKVGDDTLDGPEGATKRWESLLSAKKGVQTPALGWCTDESWFAGMGSSLHTRCSLYTKVTFYSHSPKYDMLYLPAFLIGNDSRAFVLRRPRPRVLGALCRPYALP